MPLAQITKSQRTRTNVGHAFGVAMLVLLLGSFRGKQLVPTADGVGTARPWNTTHLGHGVDANFAANQHPSRDSLRDKDDV